MNQTQTRCEICFRLQKTMNINGVQICAGCKSAYYRHNQKLLIFLLATIKRPTHRDHPYGPTTSGNELSVINNWSNITDLIHRFLTDHYCCGERKDYMNSDNCTIIGNINCKECKLVKIVLKLRKFPRNLDNFGSNIQQLINCNEKNIFDDLITRFGKFEVAKTENVIPKIEMVENTPKQLRNTNTRTLFDHQTANQID